MHAAFGRKKSTGHEAGAPLEGESEGAADLSYPEPLCENPPPIYRYERVAFGFHCGKLLWLVTNEPGAETSRGVAIGDPLADAAAAYPEAVCGTAGSEESGEYDACRVQLSPRRFIWFGGETRSRPSSSRAFPSGASPRSSRTAAGYLRYGQAE